MGVCQVREDCVELEKHYRHISKGAWPFSTQDHGWPISDCSSEGLKAVLAVEALGLSGISDLPSERLFDCVNVILSYQNKREHWGTGGWATYENSRGPAALELLNPSECFGDIVIDYSYCELTCACITALSHFHRRHPTHRAKEISEAIKLGAQWIRNKQRSDGSWYGSWGVCFTYGAWFGVVGLASVGEREGTSPHIAKALEFLRSKQREDGGWGESYLSSSTKEYHQADSSQVTLPPTSPISRSVALQLRCRAIAVRAATHLLITAGPGRWSTQHGQCLLSLPAPRATQPHLPMPPASSLARLLF